MVKYEQLRVEKESERRSLERELRDSQSQGAKVEAALARAKSDLEALTRVRDVRISTRLRFSLLLLANMVNSFSNLSLILSCE